MTSFVLGIFCFGLLIWAIGLRKSNIVLQAEIDELGKRLQEAIDRLAVYETQQKSRNFLRVVDLLAAAGVPGLVLLGAMAVSGFTGAAAITVALASIGGPAGMLGGIGVLVSIGVAIAKFGISELSIAVVKKILETKSQATVLQEINALPRVIPQKFRAKAKAMLADHVR
jgi:hypothetical protein